jgi:hypothetical protein
MFFLQEDRIMKSGVCGEFVANREMRYDMSGIQLTWLEYKYALDHLRTLQRDMRAPSGDRS